MAGHHNSANATVAASKAAAVVTDTAIAVTRALYIGVTGDLTVTMAQDGVSCTFANVPVGIFPVQVIEVSSSSTASSIVALY